MSVLYKIKLQNFEGPLDLLLFFVRKDELNIYDIPIARITKSYLEYLQLMQDLNLDIASEFILMAATLMRIKVKMMLPKDPVDEEEEEMMDPREELSRRLIEYRQFKEASKSLSELDEYWRQVYRRSYFNFDLLPQNEEEVIGLKDISFFDLLAAYKKALEKKPIPVFHNVERLNVTVEDQQKYIMDFFRDRNCYLFTELCDDMAKIEIVVTFLALLDLVKRAEIAIKQASIFDDIWIYKATEFNEEEIPESERADESIQELTNPLSAEPQAFDSGESVMRDQSDTSTEVEIEFKSDASQSYEVPQDHATAQADTDMAVPDIPSGETAHTESLQSAEIIQLDKKSTKPEENEIRAVIPSQDVLHDAHEIDLDVPVEDTEGSTNELEEILISDPVDLSPEGIESHNVVAGDDLPVENIEEEQHDEIEKRNEAVGDVLPAEKTEDDLQAKDLENVTIAETEKEPKTIEPDATQVESRPIVEIVKDDVPEAAMEPVKVEKTTETEEKIPRWKNFINKIVSMVRRIFSK
jgi:segregation and condensation protein A